MTKDDVMEIIQENYQKSKVDDLDCF